METNLNYILINITLLVSSIDEAIKNGHNLQTLPLFSTQRDLLVRLQHVSAKAHPEQSALECLRADKKSDLYISRVYYTLIFKKDV